MHVSVAAAADSALDHRAPLTAPLAVLRRDAGLPPDPSGDMPYRHLHLCACPPTFHGPGARFPATARFVRHEDRNGGTLPAWADPGDRPLVLVSLGTVFHRTPGVYEAVLDALAREPLDTAIALGPGRHPARLGQVPPNVHVHEHLPTAALLDRCALLVTHGGFNSVKESMSRGVPMVVIPIASDQHYSASRLAAVGLAQVVAPDERTPERIRAAARTVLADPSYRARAADMAADMAALPPMSAAAGWLADLVSARASPRRPAVLT